MNVHQTHMDPNMFAATLGNEFSYEQWLGNDHQTATFIASTSIEQQQQQEHQQQQQQQQQQQVDYFSHNPTTPMSARNTWNPVMPAALLPPSPTSSAQDDELRTLLEPLDQQYLTANFPAPSMVSPAVRYMTPAAELPPGPSMTTACMPPQLDTTALTDNWLLLQPYPQPYPSPPLPLAAESFSPPPAVASLPHLSRPAVPSSPRSKAHSSKSLGKIGSGPSGSSASIKAFPCEICGKVFNRSYNQQQHMLIVHAPVRTKSFICTEEGCDKSYYRAADLQRHKRVHGIAKTSQDTSAVGATAVSRFTCSTCPKTFLRNDQLRRHAKRCPGSSCAGSMSPNLQIVTSFCDETPSIMFSPNNMDVVGHQAPLVFIAPHPTELCSRGWSDRLD
ncbi:uncharacterized protein SPPG_04571 [Spizellomyces punctatus DAOM BR117]|uniref:C2H2-type domain-containing protein n=1 Tax=Spizellomyces punctatus (strain DAOM BR117) TaxID=645134 RepID=A0A0L0HHF9_SPIPD|nr:uncharacterized protein SPPG_04571 [Spizellomyces punctatus DAOM BR117]KND00239.1 hypothetical protein SPPG_04571 [Spizellomyces punctatus DAOM BR117]|eukprot:XP_016608278.1 hypothetical protein SPPG_04571 [Spizellomyces punctatus DAOM BR117]